MNKEKKEYKKEQKGIKSLAFIIAVWTVISVLAMVVSAAETSTFSCFQLSASSSGKVTIETTSTGWKILAYGTGSCSTSTQTVTFTITNTEMKDGTTPRAVDFKITTTGMETNDSNAEKTLDSSTTSLTYTATSGKGSSTSTTITISFSDIVQEPLGTSITTTVKPGVGGTVAVDGTTVTAQTDFTDTDDHVYTLVATPDSGYKFYGWMSSNGAISTDGGKTCSYPGRNTVTIWPLFIKSDSAVYFVQGAIPRLYYGYFDDAFAAAGTSGTVVVEQSGSVYGSADQSSFSIGDKQRLLIPISTSDTGIFGAYPENTTTYASTTKPTTFRYLTLPSGTTIACSGEINVNGQRRVDGQGAAGTGSPRGNHGKLILNGTGSQLTIEEAGALYCYGFITGSGAVEVKDGGVIHELMQICDWAGGSNISSWYLNTGGALFGSGDASAKIRTLFFTSRYFIQNIEAPLKVNAGAEAYAETVLTASGSQVRTSAKVMGTSDALFVLGSGTYITRTYDPTNDRVEYCVNGSGNIDLSKIIISASGYNLSSSDYTLPVNNAMTIRIGSGVTVNMSNRFAILPGAELIIEEGGTMNLTNHLYVVDVADWISNMSFGDQIAPLYTMGRGTTAKLSITNSGRLEVNGTLDISGNGCVYTTTGVSTNSTTSNSEDKIVYGTGVIYNNGTRGAGALRAGYNSTLYSFSLSEDGLANLANVGELVPFFNGTYYGQSNTYWYQHKMTYMDGKTGETLDTRYVAAHGDTYTPTTALTNPKLTISPNDGNPAESATYENGAVKVVNLVDGVKDYTVTLTRLVAQVIGTGTTDCYSLDEAKTAWDSSDEYILMYENVDGGTLDAGTVIDLNNCVLTNISVDGNGEINGIDSGTNGWDDAVGSIQLVGGGAAPVTENPEKAGDHYTAYSEDGKTYTFNRFDIPVTNYYLQLDVNGDGKFGFGATFRGNAAAADALIDMGFEINKGDGAGAVVLWVSEDEDWSKNEVEDGYKLYYTYDTENWGDHSALGLLKYGTEGKTTEVFQGDQTSIAINFTTELVKYYQAIDAAENLVDKASIKAVIELFAETHDIDLATAIK